MNEHEKAQAAAQQLRQGSVRGRYMEECEPMQAQSNALNYGVRVPLREQLEKSSIDRQRTNDRANRALEILTQHPEFELFLELQELINSGLYR
jgi:hypothetical protein